MKFKTRSFLPLFAFATLGPAALSEAAVTLDGANGLSAASTTSPFAWSHTVTASSATILLVTLSYEDANTNVGAVPSSITYGSQSLTPLATANAQPTGGENLITMWYLENPTVGLNTITVTGLTLNTAANLVRGSSVSFEGVLPGAPTIFGTFASDLNVAPSVAFTNVPGGSALYSAVSLSGATATNATTGTTLTFPAGGSFTGGQAAHHAGYNLDVSGDFSTGFSTVNLRSAMVAVVLVPEPSSLLLSALGMTGLMLRRRKD